MSKYKTYKPSNIDWIGNVPEQWKVSRIKSICSIVSGSTPSSSNESFWDGEIIWVTPGDFNKYQNQIDDSENKITEAGYKSCGTTLVPEGSIILTTRAPIGNVLVATKTLCTNQGCKSLLPKRIKSQFLFYVISISSVELNVLGQGTTFLELSKDNLSTFKIPNPSEEEQFAIITYLDEQTQKIDTLIANKKAQAEKLKELRQIEINNAVTGKICLNHDLQDEQINRINKNQKKSSSSLNPANHGSDNWKESGIEWLGKIPKHWEVKRLKNFTTIISKGTTPSTMGGDLEDTGTIKFIKAENICNNIVNTEPEFFISENTDEILFRSKLKEFDVLMVIAGATVGRTAILQQQHIPANTNQAVCFIRLNRKRLSEVFLNFWLHTSMIEQQIILDAVVSAQPNLSMTDLSMFPVVAPPIEEQIEIANYLQQRTIAIDKLIKNTETQIEKLQELRKIKIYEAVTGKICLNCDLQD